VEAIPVASCFASTAVNDEIIRLFGDVGVQVIQEHAQCRFLLPSLAGKFEAARSAKGPAASSRVVDDRSYGAH
jgi:hypothetical protein